MKQTIWAMLRPMTLVLLAFASHQVAIAREQDPRVEDAYLLQCRQGTYLTRIDGYAGDWVDSISIVCSKWNPYEQRFEAVRSGGMSAGRSSGGGPEAAFCDSSSAAVDHIVGGAAYISVNGARKQAMLRWLRVGCWDLATKIKQLPAHQIGPTVQSDDNPNGTANHCPPGELVTGLLGKETEFITQIGVLCGPAPKRFPPVVDGVENRQEDRSYPIPSPRGDAGGYLPGRVELPGRPPVPPAPPPAPAPGQGTEQYPDLPNAGPAEPVKSGKRTYGFRYPHIQNAAGQYSLLDWCSQFGTGCGQPAADMFCWATLGKKYRAIDFGEAKNIGARRATLTIRTQEICAAKHCSGFQYITCKKR